jgi:4'-phosphopantetheinyl transferase EntD
LAYLNHLTSPFNTSVAFISCHINSASGSLLRQETHAVSKFSSEKRKSSFIAGRAAAHAALKRTGFDETYPLLNGSDGEVIWPEGICGSISHSGDYAAAAVSKTGLIKGIGLDLESVARIRPMKIFNRILHKNEEHWVYDSSTDDTEKFIKGLRIFSAKEACYKAFYSATKTKLRFQDVYFTPSEESILCGVLERDTPQFERNYSFTCTSLLQNGYITSGITLFSDT